MERMKDYTVNVYRIALLVVGLLFLPFIAWVGEKKREQLNAPEPVWQFITRTDTVTVRDTVFVTAPVAASSRPLEVQTATLPATSALITATDATAPDSVEVAVPITQRYYSGENWRAWVSGYNPRLDSIAVITDRQTVTRDVIQQTRLPSKRWGLSVGVGVVATPGKIEPGVFVGVSYNLLTW